jgi:hypothetical protein
MRVIVVIPTFYADTQDIRFELALDTCREIVRCDLEAIIVDASPSDHVRNEFSKHGTSSGGVHHVRVAVQSYEGKKGAALREGIVLAVQVLADEEGVIAFQEPEKVSMVEQWSEIANKLQVSGDICAPKRTDGSFRQTYPIEQYHSENFANLYLDSLAKQVGFPSIDWTMGPIAFRSSLAKHWQTYKGDLWDMQLVPMIRAQRWYEAKVINHEFDYQHPTKQTEEERGSPKWNEKRLFQLNFLFRKSSQGIK